MPISRVQAALALIALTFTTPLFAAEHFRPITVGDASFPYYQAVINGDPRVAADSILDYNFKGAVGRVVSVKSGDAVNPLNIVLSVNGILFYVPVRLATMDGILSFRRRWDDDPGIFLIVRGYRRGPNAELVRTACQLKIANTSAMTLPAVVYNEIEFSTIDPVLD
jgi:hypothetical protein